MPYLGGNRMSALIDLLLTRTARERLLLALLCAVVVPLALVFGALMPLAEARKTAEAAHAEALATGTWLAARAAELQLLPAPVLAGTDDVTAAQDRAPIGAAALEESLKRVGLRPALTALDSDSDGGVTLRFDAVRFVALADWLRGSQPRWGYDLARLDLTQLDLNGAEVSGKVRALIVLTPL